MFWKIIILFGILWKIFNRWQRRRLYSLSSKLNTDFKKYPFIGNAYMLIGNEEERMKAIELIGRDSIKHDGMSNFWLGGNYNIVLLDADALKVVLKECLEKNNVVLFSRNLVGNGSAIAPVAIWRPRRRVLALTFHHKYLNQFMNIFTKQSKFLVKKLQNVSGTGPFSIWPYTTAHSMDVVCQTTFGVHVNAQKCKNEPFIKAFDECLRLLAQRMAQPWLHSDLIYEIFGINTEFIKNKRIITNFFSKAIASKRQSIKKEEATIKQKTQVSDYEPNEIKTSLDMLIELSGDEQGYTNLELLEETMIIVLAAIDTSAICVSFTALMLAKHMDIQQKVYQELQHVFGDSDGDIVSEDLPRLKYLGAVIKESLRLYPPLPVIARKIERDIKLPSGLTLVKECEVVAHIWALHRNPQYWGDDAEIFKPERFMEPLKYPNAFIPFSNGPRNCIGYQYAMMSIKTTLAYLLRTCRFLPAEYQNCDSNPSKDEPVPVTYNILLKAVNKFTLKLEMRNK